MTTPSTREFESEVTALLAERADRAVVQPGINFVPDDGPDTGASRWWMAVAAMLVVIGGGALVLSPGSRDSTAAGPGSEPRAGDLQARHDLVVWMEPGADERAVQQVAVLLALAPAVDEFVYVDQEATYAEFVEYYVSEEPELLDIVDPERLPTSFRVQSQAPDSLIGILSNQDGVAEVDVPTPDG